MSSPREQTPLIPTISRTMHRANCAKERSQFPFPKKQVRSPPRSPNSQPPSPDIRLKTPVYLRHPPVAEVIHGPAGPERELRPAALFGLAGRFAAVAAFVMVVALLFVLMSPALRQSDASLTSSEITGATTTALPQASQEENGSKPALDEFRGVLAAAPASKPATPEQPPQLLQQFLQWRQKANSTETSQ